MKCLMVLLGMAALNVLAADAPDNKSIQGAWIPVQAELAGRPMADAVLKTISMTLGEGTYDVLAAGKPDKGTFEIDPSASPKSMVVKGTEGPNKGKSFPAIYELDRDTLRICYDLSGANRPKEFKTLVGTKLYLVTYQRKK